MNGTEILISVLSMIRNHGPLLELTAFSHVSVADPIGSNDGSGPWSKLIAYRRCRRKTEQNSVNYRSGRPHDSQTALASILWSQYVCAGPIKWHVNKISYNYINVLVCLSSYRVLRVIKTGHSSL